MARQKPNSGEHIADIINRNACDKHNVPLGVPCFHVRYDGGKGEYGPAVCGTRIEKAGFNGQIQPSSLSRKTTKGEARARR